MRDTASSTIAAIAEGAGAAMIGRVCSSNSLSGLTCAVGSLSVPGCVLRRPRPLALAPAREDVLRAEMAGPRTLGRVVPGRATAAGAMDFVTFAAAAGAMLAFTNAFDEGGTGGSFRAPVRGGGFSLGASCHGSFSIIRGSSLGRCRTRVGCSSSLVRRDGVARMEGFPASSSAASSAASFATAMARSSSPASIKWFAARRYHVAASASSPRARNVSAVAISHAASSASFPLPSRQARARFRCRALRPCVVDVPPSGQGPQCSKRVIHRGTEGCA